MATSEQQRIIDILSQKSPQTLWNIQAASGLNEAQLKIAIETLQSNNIVHLHGGLVTLLHDSSLIDALLPSFESITQQTPGLHDPPNLFTFHSFSVLVISPFFQGLCYGLGEGLGRIWIGNWIGIDPVAALIGRMPRKPRISGSGMFSRFFSSLLGPFRTLKPVDTTKKFNE